MRYIFDNYQYKNYKFTDLYNKRQGKLCSKCCLVSID